MRGVYFDCYAGVSGDMLIGALIDLGVDIDTLRQQLSSLKLSGYEIRAHRVKRSGIAATKFDVDVDPKAQPARAFAEIREIISDSALSAQVKARAIAAFARLAEAEARVHDTTVEKVHFHEVGAVDAIIDIVGAMIGFEALGVERFYSSPLRTGYGTVKAEHGLLPIPAPGTAELLKGVPVYAGELEGEFVTPTGAAIVTTLCESFGPLPPMQIDRTGYGAGSRDPEGFPNALRLILGDVAAQPSAAEPESVMVVETNIDDMNPQVYGFVMERAFALGALDVFMTPAQMKKDRPGVLLTALCAPDRLDSITEMLLAETSTLGVRYYQARRRVLDRVIEEVETPYGCVRIKVARDGARTLHYQPEYEDCARLAAGSQAPLIEVQQAAIQAYRDRMEEEEGHNEKHVKSEER
ncbi:MAG TPA: nickel pincer cofactor biosynthesis protein LarC [Blastocatellia bacterium]|nr:nickel pincer cofactor biosynthesis protein LarC [Blastocatellia bacterium]